MTEQPVCYRVASEHTSPIWCEAFAQGCGGRISDQSSLEPGPVALFGSLQLWPLLQSAQAHGRTWYYGDHSYLGQPWQRYRITRNAYQHDGQGDASPDRFHELRQTVSQWRHGSHILVCLQGEGQYKLFGMTLSSWLSEVVSRLKGYTDRPVVIRSRYARTPLRNELSNAWAVVTWSSNAAVDALLYGVPVFVTADFAAAYRMGTPDLSRIETPWYPDDRERFFSVLAANQWTMDEIRAGHAWADLRGGSELRRAS